MADGKIKINIEVDGKPVKVASKDLDQMEKTSQNSSKGIKKAEKSMDDLANSSKKASKDVKGAKDETKGAGDESEKAGSKIKKFATALGLVAVGVAAFNALKNSVDAAITRFDTLNKFPKVLQALGVSAEDSEKAMNKLSDGIDGLPTTLNEIAGNAQRMYTSFNDMDKATDTALALNNALLGSGSSAEDAQRGTEQYLQALQRGKFEMEEWKTLQETMDIGLIKVAESFGYTGKTAKQDLYGALKDGIVTMDQFNDKLIEVGTGTGIMAKLAKENSLGISTSLSNLRNAAAKGIAGIIDSFNKLSIEVTGKDIAQNIDGLKSVVNASFKVIGNVIEATAPIVKGFAVVIKGTIPVIEALAPVLIGAATAYAGLMIITKVSSAIKASNAVLNTAMASQKALTIATKAQITAQIASTAATKADAVATVAQTGAVKLSTLAIGVLTGKIKLAKAAAIAFAAAKKLMMGPVGWVTAGIGALAGAVVGVVKWFNRESAEAKKLKAETEELGNSTNELNDAIASTAENYKNKQSEIIATAKANQELARRIDELSKRENKSASEKALLNSYIEELNESVEGLNLAYSEEANALNMSSEKLQARINLMNEQEKAQEAQSRLTEILKEQAEVESKLEETNALRDEWNQKLEEGAVKSSEYKDEVEKLDEKEKQLKETTAQLAEQQKATEEQMTQSMTAITEMTAQNIDNQIIKFDELSKEQQKVIEDMQKGWQDYLSNATNMFDTLSDKTEISVKEMTKNMQENQRIMSEWADNIATLADRGLNQGLLEKLKDAGPESAGHVKALVNASDAELEELNAVFEKSGETSMKAFRASLDESGKGVMDSLGHLVTSASDSLKQQIKDADFSNIGVDVADGLAGGIDKGSKKSAEASKNMADKATKATREAFKTHSPSRVYKDIGTDVSDGLALGISNGTKKVIQTMKKVATSMISAYQSTPDKFNSIGKNAMAGLNQGLLAGRANVLATARSIANSVASTMKSALRIHSPSRLMRDEIGKMIPDGIVLGIQANANKVGKEMNRVADMIITTPEQALGVSNMRYASAGNYLERGRESITNNNNKSFSSVINNYFTREESTPSEVAKKNRQQQQRLAMDWGYR